jgi:hypothetical protein
MNLTKDRGENWCPAREDTSCFTTSTRLVTLAKIPVISDGRGKEIVRD